MSFFEVAREIANRLISIFLRDGMGRRPVFGGLERFQSNPYRRDHILSTSASTGTTGPGSV